jgi:hypothetical protein
MHEYLYSEPQETGREQRYEPVSFGASYKELPLCCKLAYIEVRVHYNLDRSAELQREIQELTEG